MSFINEQVENTPTVIVLIGDSRIIKWRRQILCVSKESGRLKFHNVDKEDWFTVSHL